MDVEKRKFPLQRKVATFSLRHFPPVEIRPVFNRSWI